MSLQEGIAWGSTAAPGAYFALVCLRRQSGTAIADIAGTLSGLWTMYDELKRGRLPDLPHADDDGSGLQCLIGFGPRAFDRAAPEVARELRECAFLPAAKRRSPADIRAVLPGTSLAYADDVADNGADADVAVQITAHSQAAVTRAVVETRRYLRGTNLEPSGVYLGYRRIDRRSWLGFYDGVDNIAVAERANAVLVGPHADDAWLRGGTYLAFLRITIDVDLWDTLAVPEQEVVVGRVKASGAPLVATNGRAEAVPLAPGTRNVFAERNLAVREPIPVDFHDATGLGRSHVHRARRHPNLRIFRQGYEFLDVQEPAGLRPGLNFVSFQSAPLRIATVLRVPSWLGGSGFGGSDPQLGPLMAVRAAGLFAVPPVTGPGVPGVAALSAL